MTIKWVSGMSIFDHPPEIALTVPVNGVGAMGMGLAKEFKERWTELYIEYLEPLKIVCYVHGEKK